MSVNEPKIDSTESITDQPYVWLYEIKTHADCDHGESYRELIHVTDPTQVHDVNRLVLRAKDRSERDFYVLYHGSWRVPHHGQRPKPANPVVALPPGHKLAAAAELLLTRGAFKRYVEPVIADMQQEYIEAIAAGRERRAQWIAIRGHLLVFPNWLYALIAGQLAALLRRGG